MTPRHVGEARRAGAEHLPDRVVVGEGLAGLDLAHVDLITLGPDAYVAFRIDTQSLAHLDG